MSNIVFEEEGDEMDDDELASCSLPVVPASRLSPRRQALKAEERDDESAQPAQSAPALFAQNMNIEYEQQQQPQDAAAAAEVEAAEAYKNEQEEQPDEEAVAAAQATRFGCTGGTIAKSRFDDEEEGEGESAAAASQVPQPPPDFRGIDLGECDESDDDDSSSDDNEDEDEFDDDIIEMSHEVLPEPQEDDDDDGLSDASDESEDFAKDWDWDAMSADEAAASASAADTDSEHSIKQELLSKKRPRRNALRACRVKEEEEEEAQENTKKKASFRSYKVTPKKQKTSNGDDGAAASTSHHHRNDEYRCDNSKCYGATCTWKKYTCSRCNKSYHKRCCILYELPKTAIEQLEQPWTCYDCRPLCECGCGEKLPWENMKGTKHPGIIHCSRCDKCFRTSCITISARNHRMCNACAGTKYPAKKEVKPAEQPAEVPNVDEMEDIPAE